MSRVKVQRRNGGRSPSWEGCNLRRNDTASWHHWAFHSDQRFWRHSADSMMPASCVNGDDDAGLIHLSVWHMWSTRGNSGGLIKMSVVCADEALCMCDTGFCFGEEGRKRWTQSAHGAWVFDTFSSFGIYFQWSALHELFVAIMCLTETSVPISSFRSSHLMTAHQVGVNLISFLSVQQSSHGCHFSRQNQCCLCEGTRV